MSGLPLPIGMMGLRFSLDLWAGVLSMHRIVLVYFAVVLRST